MTFQDRWRNAYRRSGRCDITPRCSTSRTVPFSTRWKILKLCPGCSLSKKTCCLLYRRDLIACHTSHLSKSTCSSSSMKNCIMADRSLRSSTVTLTSLSNCRGLKNKSANSPDSRPQRARNTRNWKRSAITETKWRQLSCRGTAIWRTRSKRLRKNWMHSELHHRGLRIWGQFHESTLLSPARNPSSRHQTICLKDRRGRLLTHRCQVSCSMVKAWCYHLWVPQVTVHSTINRP